MDCSSGSPDLGVNGVWLHVVLRQLAPSPIFPEFGAGHERRIENLRRLVERAKKYGIDIYLYMNEPRAMDASFFQGREGIKGVQEGDFHTLCTSAPEVRQWLTDSLTYVFKQVPGLGGVFTITASENLTNCYSHSRTAAGCPRCVEAAGAGGDRRGQQGHCRRRLGGQSPGQGHRLGLGLAGCQRCERTGPSRSSRPCPTTST